MDLNSVSVHKHAKKEPGQYPAILTSHLVNNPYILVKTYVAGRFVVVFTENQVKMMGRDAKQSPNFKLVVKTAKF